MAKATIKKIVLAYSGGLDTSIILKWLQTTYGCEVVTFTADLGQGEELGPAREKALMLGIKPENIFIEDLREEFVRDYVFPMFRANALYEGQYLLGTSIARPLIAKKQIEIAAQSRRRRGVSWRDGQGQRPGALRARLLRAQPLDQDRGAVAGVDVQGPRRPDRVRAHAPDPDRQGQGRRGAVLGRRQPAALVLRGQGAGGSRRRRRRRSSICARSRRWTRPTSRPRCASASRAATRCRVDGKAMSPASILARLNELGRANGIGRLDLVENRFVGMKSRGVYETPGGTILLAAHRAIESITLDRGAAHLKDEIMPRYAELIYNGFWFAPEREMLQALIDKSQEHVEGEVRLTLYKGNVIVAGRESAKSLYSSTLVTFEDDKGAYDQKDAEGFIRLNALRLRTLGLRDEEVAPDSGCAARHRNVAGTSRRHRRCRCRPAACGATAGVPCAVQHRASTTSLSVKQRHSPPGGSDELVSPPNWNTSAFSIRFLKPRMCGATSRRLP